MSAVIAISNRKGGTGKTATAVNLTAAAAASGRRTLLIDLDTQGHAGIGFGITSRSGEPSVHDLFRSGEIDLIDTIRPSGFERVSVAPADPMFDGSASERSPSRLARQLRRPEIAERFDLVVIDTPPAYDMLLINALAAADGVIVPTLPHALSAEGVRQFARILFKVATSLNPAIQLLGLLPVMIGANALHHRATTEGLARDFGADRILQGIRSDIRVAEAFGQRKPLREHAPDCRAAEDYDRLFLQLAERRAFTPRQACYN